MFLDSLANDAAWLGRYARSREGEVIPWGVVEQMIQDTHPYEVFMVRRGCNTGTVGLCESASCWACTRLSSF